MNVYGKRLKSLRERAGWTQPALAELINRVRPEWRWHQTTIAKIEAGSRSLKLEDLLAYAEVFGLTLDQLVTETEWVEVNTGDPIQDHLEDPDRLVNERLDEARKTRIRRLDWEIQQHRDRLAELETERAAEIDRLSPWGRDEYDQPERGD
jgi:transcriptional regulator with XRE-family HTH domain